jgi:hypothetical protein
MVILEQMVLTTAEVERGYTSVLRIQGEAVIL